MKTWFWIVGWSLLILTITGNGFIIFLVCRRRQLRTKTNAFVVSLAVADFCVGMTVPSLFAFKETDPETELPDEVKLYIRLLFVQTSVTNLCSLVLDRYMAVKKPLKYLTFMKRRCVIQMVFLSWAIPVFFYAIRSFLHFTFRTRLIDNIIIWLDTIIFKFVPFFMLIFCFSCTLSVICKHDRVVRNVVKQLRFNSPVCIDLKVAAVLRIWISLWYFEILFEQSRQRSLRSSFYHNTSCSFKLGCEPIAYALLKRDMQCRERD